MSDVEQHRAGREARRSAPRRIWTPEEEHRQEMLQRYLNAVASAAASRAGKPAPSGTAEPASGQEAAEPRAERRAAPPKPLHVRDVMQVPAASVRGDTAFLDVARTLAHEHVGSVPVVDSEDHVVGVVSESDLLAKAAVMAAPHRLGPVGRLREHRLYGKSRGETAATLMTFPAVTVHPAELVSDAAWTAARSRLKRMPVTDHRGRLVGVVSRGDLLRALVRDDDEILGEIESGIVGQAFHIDPEAVEVTVENGTVTVSGRLDRELATRVLDSIREIEDVVDVVDRLHGT